MAYSIPPKDMKVTLGQRGVDIHHHFLQTYYVKDNQHPPYVFYIILGYSSKKAVDLLPVL